MLQEKKFENRIKKFLDYIGAYYVKNFGGYFTRAGIADLTICYKGRYIAVEVKAENGRVAPLQYHHKKLVKNAGGISMVLRPSQFKEFTRFMYALPPAGKYTQSIELELENGK